MPAFKIEATGKAGAKPTLSSSVKKQVDAARANADNAHERDIAAALGRAIVEALDDVPTGRDVTVTASGFVLPSADGSLSVRVEASVQVGRARSED
jgi:hypothetical protein